VAAFANWIRVRTINRLAALIAGIGVFVMMLVGAVDVVATQFFNRPVPGAFEITETMMVACIFFGLAMAQERRQHIRVELVTQTLPSAAQTALDAVADIASSCFFLLIAWYGVNEALKSVMILEFTSGIVSFPVWPSKLALALGSVLMVAQCLLDAASSIRRIARSRESAS
jgi:TRAP-type C4-dicarboxylate transport system permease small subunit